MKKCRKIALEDSKLSAVKCNSDAGFRLPCGCRKTLFCLPKPVGNSFVTPSLHNPTVVHGTGAKFYLLWHIVTLNYCLHCMTLRWSCVALHGFLWSFMVLCSYVVVWFYIAFSRGHRSKFIWSC